MHYQPHLLPQKDKQSFIHNVKQFILAETTAQREEIQRIWAKPLPTRISEGHAIGDTHVVNHLKTGQLVITCEQNESRFREGDAIRLHRGDTLGKEPPFFDATIDIDNGIELTITPAFINRKDIREHRTRWVLDASLVDLSRPILEAINDAADTPTGHRRILPLLMQELEPSILALKYDHGLPLGEACGLNETQIEAFANVVAPICNRLDKIKQ